MSKMVYVFGKVMLSLADYIYSLTSGLLGGEEIPLEEMC